jgi:Spy/CpxP family protein refolding chaperone
MKRSYSLTLGFAVLALTGVLSLTTSAWARAPRQGFDHMSQLKEKIDALNLDDTTHTAIYKALDEGRVAQDDIRSHLRKARQELRAMLQKDNPPEDQVLAQSEVIGGLETKQRKQALHTLLTVRSLLTPEQRVSLREAMRPHGPLKHDQER